MRQTTVLTVIRVFIGLVFLTYGLVKVLGGQYDYRPWMMDKATVDGSSLVWASTATRRSTVGRRDCSSCCRRS